jgi:ubiquinone/menaquinone biosynthesis C-methylase UbiE
MGSRDTVFDGSIPATYDRYMVPLVFRPYAEIAAARARQLHPERILETAAGTGVLTQALHRALPEAEIVATDVNQPMLDQATRRVTAPNVSFRQADALGLPFDDGGFDLVACQFGVMFFPDKVRGNAEARRVLRAGGTYLLLIWDSVDRNLATKVAGAAVAELFPGEQASFYERIPFRYHDRRVIEDDLRAAGFADVQIETVQINSRAASALDAAIGLTQGTPLRSEIESRDPGLLGAATDAATRALQQFEGPNGLEAPMSAHLVTATK